MLRALVLPLVRASAVVSSALLHAALASAPSNVPPFDSAPPSAPASTKPLSSDEILVTASRMRLVDLTYSLRDRRLSSCTITKSSGVREVDVTVCTILDTCLREGHTKPFDAKSCLNDAIADFRKGKRDLAGLTGQYSRDFDVQFAPDQAEREKLATLAAGRNGSPPSPSPEAVTPEPPPIVVTGNRNPITAGQWQFEQTGYLLTDTNVRTLGRTWFVCITDGALHYTIDDMIQRSFFSPDVPSWCQRWNVALAADDTITGDQRCWVGKNVRMKGELKGHVSADEIHLQRVMYLHAIQTTSALIDPEAHMDIDGQRIGDCDPNEARPSGSAFLPSPRRQHSQRK
ncbi:hypothetical protein [Novosphingobium sp. 9]|uniref:hypothetical protein n=1 Tax=Novosphingobium sp. 9 TaxID=2025349 RepID=UPI0021B57257|nr:hypothetical protein [Novosphingobium sp. 9]